MHRRILESDELNEDVRYAVLNRINYRGYRLSGIRFWQKYDKVIGALALFSDVGIRTEVNYRGYSIVMLPFDTYYIFYIVREEGDVVILRMLHQKQNWKKIMDMNKLYHIYGKAI